MADDLSALADCVLRVTTRWCWERLRQRHQAECRFGIIAYGKLGGKNWVTAAIWIWCLSTMRPDERAGEIYAALVRRRSSTG